MVSVLRLEWFKNRRSAGRCPHDIPCDDFMRIIGIGADDVKLLTDYWQLSYWFALVRLDISQP